MQTRPKQGRNCWLKKGIINVEECHTVERRQSDQLYRYQLVRFFSCRMILIHILSTLLLLSLYSVVVIGIGSNYGITIPFLIIFYGKM